MRSPAPLVSVVMPVFDGERFLAAAVASVLGQRFDDFELLLYDDGSTDRSVEVALACAGGDPRLRLFRKAHAGYSVWLQEGIAAARGEFVARMDADDVAHPERLGLQVDYLRRHPECAVVGSDALLVDPDGRPIRPLGVRLAHAEIEAELLAGRGDAILHPAALFRRSALQAVDGYRPEFEPAEDLDLYLRLAERFRLANLPQTLLAYRQHLGKVSAERKGAQRRAQRAILRQAHRRRGLAAPPEGDESALPERLPAIDSWHRWAHGAIEARHLATARRYAWRVFRAEPCSRRATLLLLRALFGLRRETLHQLVPRSARPL